MKRVVSTRHNELAVWVLAAAGCDAFGHDRA